MPGSFVHDNFNNFNLLDKVDILKEKLQKRRSKTLVIQRCRSEYAEDLWVKMEKERPQQITKFSK